MHYTKTQVAKHNTEKDCWVIVDNNVYDITKFLKDHPGGKRVLLHFAGKDISEFFHAIHLKTTFVVFLCPLKIGIIEMSKL